MTGYILMDIIAVLALGAALAWGVVRHQRWRKTHPLPRRPSEAEIERTRAEKRQGR